MRIRTTVRGESGAAAVEFALIAPLLFMILFGIMQFGIVWSQKEIYVQAAREGARFAAVGCEKPLGCSSTDVANRVVDASVGYPITGAIAVNPSPGCSATNTSQTVTVQWTQAFTVQIPFIPTMNIDAPIKAVFRCEA